MAESRRSGDQSGIVVKNRSSSGCLIVRKKIDDVSLAGSSGARKVLGSKKEKKRPRMVMSDSGSSDELLIPPRRRVGPETIKVCNGLSGLEKGVGEESGFGKNRDRDRVEQVTCNEDGLFGRAERQNDRKRNRLDVFEFDEYDGSDEEMMVRQKHLRDTRMDIGGRGSLGGSMASRRDEIGREFETRSSSQAVVDKRKNLYFERTSSFNQGGMNRFGINSDAGRVPISLLREKYVGDSDEPIRLQGKNGVLKVMLNKKKKVGEPVKNFDHVDTEENQNSSRIEDKVKRNVLEKSGSFLKTEKNQLTLRKSLTKKIKDDGSDSDDSDTALKLEPKRMEACKSVKEVSSESEKTHGGKSMLTRIKEGKVQRGSGTEKQKLRERIRAMLVEAGWTIDYRPRKNRDYLDAVYINPAGTAYWSIIKAYDALLKQLNDEEDEDKPSADGSPFTPLSVEVLSQLTRNTRKKLEKEKKKKQRDGSLSLSTRETAARRASSARCDEGSMGSDNHEEKLISFLKQGGKSSKGKMNENGIVSQNSKCQSSTHLLDTDEKPTSTSSSHMLHGRKSRKLGRCTLLVRRSIEGPNSETDGFVPYAGKRTLLSWLIDCGTVQLSQKVQYMNRRRTKVMLEGWIARDGIHCGCCSKILTVTKFELHAGSKLRQPFQNIYLDSGVSLLQCQIDAWNRLKESDGIGFDSVDVDGDDPNDDTCGICGDGGDLICCDGCPSTFHQSCLDIQMLPPGDWHCPNCTCKFCGRAGEDDMQGDQTTISALLTCSLCEKKYHKLCMQETDALADTSTGSVTYFCGQKCQELSEHLQKYMGVKHELEAGFSWSLIHRSDEDSDTSLRVLPQWVECNSKLAVALTVMDECFLPIIDRRSGINLIHNVLYNSGSNFNRLNYSGFYTAVLERGDEIISAASIRFHGTQLAEMPFIGTRPIYRRQGMCRRLFCALESALCSLNVEKLIIPAIAELMHTWTTVFGFTPLKKSLKQEMRSLNMLVFPGIDMLQKLLLEQDIKENIASPDSKKKELKVKHEMTPEMENKADIDSSTEHDSRKSARSDSLHPNAINGEVAALDFDSKYPGASSNSSSMLSGSSPAHVSVKGTCTDSKSADKLVESVSDGNCLSNSGTTQIRERENKPESASTAADVNQSSKEGDMDVGHAVDVNGAASHEVENSISAVDTVGPDSQSGNKLAESDLDQKCIFTGDRSAGSLEKGYKPESDSPVDGNTQFTTECDTDNAGDMAFTAAASHEVKIVVSVEETPDSQSRDKLAKSASVINCASNPSMGKDAIEMENKQVSIYHVEDNNQPGKEADDTGDARSIDVNATAHEVVQPVSVEELKSGGFHSGDKLVEDGVWSCRVGAMIDADALDNNIDPSHEPEIPISVAGSIITDLELGEKSAESTSEGECLFSETNFDEPQVKRKPSHSPSEDNSTPCKVDNSDDKHPKAAPSLGEITAESTTEAGNVIPAGPPTSLDGFDVSSSMQGAKGQELNVSSETGSEESSLHSSGDEGKTKSSSA